MNGLRTARVVVVDDAPAEALPVITAMGRLGIGCIHIRGESLEELPAEPFIGIRLAFVDMQLAASGDARQIGAHTANVFAHVVSPGSAPLLLLLWTKHLEFVDEFKRALFEHEPKYRAGLLIEAMDKPQRAEDINIEAILAQAQALVNKNFPIETLWLWEQLSHNATTDTTNAVTNVVTGRAAISTSDTDVQAIEKWRVGLSDVFRWLIHAAAGKSSDETTALDDLLQAMVQIHQDRLENQPSNPAERKIGEVLRGSGANPTTEDRSVLNTMLLIAPVRPKDLTVRPGNCYIPHPEVGAECLHAKCGVIRAQLVSEVFAVKNDSDCKRLTGELNSLKRETGVESTRIAAKQSELDGQITNATNQWIPVLLEVTAFCDFAQRKSKVARFLGGLLVPESDENLIVKKKDSNHALSAVKIGISGKNLNYLFVISSRLPYVLQLNSVSTAPLFRLRGPVLQEIQSWSASHSARPGYIKVEPS